MPEGCLVPNPPVLDVATLEQALRWVAYKLPPLEARFERLEEYPAVLWFDQDDWAAGVSDNVGSEWAQLVKALALGAITATGIPHTKEWRDKDGNAAPPREVPSGDRMEVPANIWSLEAIEWKVEYGQPTIELFDNFRKFKFLMVNFTDLKRVFQDAADDHWKRDIARLSEAVYWVAYGTYAPPIDGERQGDVEERAWSKLHREGRSGKLRAEGLWTGEWSSIQKGIAANEWKHQSNWRHDWCGDGQEVVVSVDDLKRIFPPASPPPPKDEVLPIACGKKRGAPPKVEREVWLERLAVLALAGVLNASNTQYAAAKALIDDLKRRGEDNGVRADTVRKDWLAPLLREAKGLGGGK